MASNAKSPGKRKKQDPLTKRFTNGHKCFTSMQSKFMVEIMAKDEDKRLAFEDKKFVLKAHRNPVNGEMTARDDAPYLVAFDSAVMSNEAAKSRPEATTTSLIEDIVSNSRLRGATQSLKVIAEVERCNTLRSRRDLLEAEMDMVNQVLEHKRICAQGGFTGQGAPKVKFGKVVPRRPF